MPSSASVPCAGLAGVPMALHLRRRGRGVVLVDRRAPGEGASFGNGGLIRREAAHPHPFPPSVPELLRIARNRSIDAVCHPLALPGLASPLLRHWCSPSPRATCAPDRHLPRGAVPGRDPAGREQAVG